MKRKLKNFVGVRQTERRIRLAAIALQDSSSDSSSDNGSVLNISFPSENEEETSAVFTPFNTSNAAASQVASVTMTASEIHNEVSVNVEQFFDCIESNGSDVDCDISHTVSENETFSLDWSSDDNTQDTSTDEDIESQSSDFSDVENEDQCYSDDERRQEIFRQRLRHWVVETNVTRDSVNKLLVILRKEVSFQFLPKTCRTLLGTQRKVTTYSLTPGNFYDFKIIDGITFSLELLQVNFHSTETCLNMYVGCDGIPITKSSNSNFWPILGLLQLDGAQPFEIGLYHGKAKPDDSNDLMRNFISECLDLIENGFRNKGTLIRIKILAFCCDAPAMSFLKKVKPFNAYFGCQKCETEGLYVFNTKKEGGRVTFPQCDAKLRTDESFRYQQQAEHHFDQQVSNLNL